MHIGVEKIVSEHLGKKYVYTTFGQFFKISTSGV